MERRDHRGAGIKETANKFGAFYEFGTGIDSRSFYWDFEER